MKIKEIEISEEEYEEMLNENYPEIDVLGCSYQAGYLLKEIDPIRFRCGMSEEPIKYECGNCGKIYEDKDEAEECCKVDCEECGKLYETEEEALNCCKDKKPND